MLKNELKTHFQLYGLQFNDVDGNAYMDIDGYMVPLSLQQVIELRIALDKYIKEQQSATKS